MTTAKAAKKPRSSSPKGGSAKKTAAAKPKKAAPKKAEPKKAAPKKAAPKKATAKPVVEPVVPKPAAPKAPAVKEADAIELLRRTCAKGQMVIDAKQMPLADWLKSHNYATTAQQGPTWRLYPTTQGRKLIRETPAT